MGLLFKMRIEQKYIPKKGSEGSVTLIPTDDEDLWHIYNLIQKGDNIRMKTRRKTIDDSNASGLRKVQMRILTLTLLIVDISYFADADRLAISVKGRNRQENNFLKVGQYHTFRVELDTKLTIYKAEWSAFQVNLIKDLKRSQQGSQIAAMVMEEGVAHLCYVKNSITLIKKKIDKNVAKKSCGDEIYKKSLNKFLNECYVAIKSLQIDRIKCIVLASPGFLNEQLLKYTKVEAEREENKEIMRSLGKFILAKCSNGYLASLNEVLADPMVAMRMENTKAISQTKVLEEFYTVMKKNENRVAYGEKEVAECIRLKAVDKLLICDFLFRSKDFAKRKVYNDLFEEVKEQHGEAIIFSTLHPSGEKLKNISGIAAILRFDVTVEEEEDDQESVKSSSSEEDQEKQMEKLKEDNFMFGKDSDEQN